MPGTYYQWFRKGFCRVLPSEKRQNNGRKWQEEKKKKKRQLNKNLPAALTELLKPRDEL